MVCLPNARNDFRMNREYSKYETAGQRGRARCRKGPYQLRNKNCTYCIQRDAQQMKGQRMETEYEPRESKQRERDGPVQEITLRRLRLSLRPIVGAPNRPPLIDALNFLTIPNDRNVIEAKIVGNDIDRAYDRHSRDDD
jgi:hypothetical protein